MVARTFSAALQGVDGVLVEIEASCQPALPKIQITGLPGEIIRESRERVKACLGQLGFDVPSSHALVHLSPAHARKQGSHFDLPIAISLLVAEGILDPKRVRETAFLGELRLDGRIEPVAGTLALLERLEREPAVSAVVIPAESAVEAGVLRSRKARLAAHLAEVIDYLRGHVALPEPVPLPAADDISGGGPTINDVIGQGVAKRALEIALAGDHHLLLVGPPGVGKSLLAQCIPSLLPPLQDEEVVPVLKNYVHCSHQRLWLRERPFRSPHHSLSAAALLGGGTGTVVPGEVTLAHRGVLFLDEFPEFRKDALEGLREPLQNGIIHIHRVGQALALPARFLLVAAMNPCPCGYSLGGGVRCRCSREQVLRYRRRVSGPLVDRFDVGVLLHPPREEAPGPVAAVSREVRERVARVRALRLGWPRASLETQVAQLGAPERAWLENLPAEGRVSYRGIGKLIRVGRTVAALAGEEAVRLEHLREAWSYRCWDTFFRG